MEADHLGRSLDTIADKMKEAIDKYGPSSIAISQGTGRGYNRYTHRFARSMGTGQYHHPRLCLPQPPAGPLRPGHRLRPALLRLSRLGRRIPQDPDHLGQAAGNQQRRFRDGYWFMNSLDYARTSSSSTPGPRAYTSRATLWLQPRPGTDAALALGMMNVIIKEGLWDKEFVENWTYGFEELKERVDGIHRRKKSPKSPGYPKRKSSRPPGCLPIDTPGCIQVGSSLERQANCGQTLRAIICLLGITGNIERPGSMISWVLPDTGLIEDFFNEIPITDEMKKNIIGGDKFKMGAARTCNPDTVDQAALIPAKPRSRSGSAWAGSRSSIWPTPKRWSRRLKKVDFMVQVDLFMGPMAETADIVLPAAHWLEMDDIYDMHPRFMIEAHNKVRRAAGRSQVRTPGSSTKSASGWPRNTGLKDVENMLDYQLKKSAI